MKLQKRLLLLSAIAALAMGVIGCGTPEEEAPTGPTGSVPQQHADAPGQGANTVADAQAAPPGVATGTPNGK